MSDSHTSYHYTSALPSLAAFTSKNYQSRLAVGPGILANPPQAKLVNPCSPRFQPQIQRSPALSRLSVNHESFDTNSSDIDRRFAATSTEPQAFGSSLTSKIRNERRKRATAQHTQTQHELVKTLASSQSSSLNDRVQIRKLTSRLSAAQRTISQLEVTKANLERDIRELKEQNADLAAQIRRQPPPPPPPRSSFNDEKWDSASSPSPVSSPARSFSAGGKRRRSSSSDSSPILIVEEKTAATSSRRTKLAFPADAAQLPQQSQLSLPKPPCATDNRHCRGGRLVAGGRSSESSGNTTESELSDSKSAINWVDSD